MAGFVEMLPFATDRGAQRSTQRLLHWDSDMKSNKKLMTHLKFNEPHFFRILGLISKMIENISG